MNRPQAMRARAFLLGVALLLGSASVARAHPLAPALLQIDEHEDGTADVAWKTPLMRVRGSHAEPELPANCRQLEKPVATEGTDSVTFRWRIDCGADGLAGHTIAVRGLETSKTDALVRVSLADGRLVRGVVRAFSPTLEIPLSERPPSVFGGYLQLGFDHILEGVDHLLFVFGLLLLATSTRLLVETITAFTVGHSVTLTLAAFGLADVPQAPVEVLIAASIFVLAIELAHGRENPEQQSLLRRYPWLMAFLFGLLHGLGFAGALRAIGLPEGDLPLALLSFNIGIELGQLTFVAAVLAAGYLLRRVLARRPAWSEWVPIYAMGCLSAYWVLARLEVVWNGRF
jgi:hydrogenase/urease accessory protein HupE